MSALPTPEPARVTEERPTEPEQAPASEVTDTQRVEPAHEPDHGQDHEPTVVIEAKPRTGRSAKTVKVSTVPESRRAKARARREAHEKAKAEKAAARADAKAAKVDPAEILVSKLPRLKPAYAAMLTGVIAGAISVLLAKGASVGCEAVRDEDSCGGGLGLLALVAILAIEVLIGANLLKAWKVADPFSTSFLGVGLVAMVSMLFFLQVLDSPRMLVVIPLITAVSFLISWWVTVRFVEEPDDEPDSD